MCDLNNFHCQIVSRQVPFLSFEDKNDVATNHDTFEAANLNRGPSAVDDVAQHDAVALTQGKAGSAGLDLSIDTSEVRIGQAIEFFSNHLDINSFAVYCYTSYHMCYSQFSKSVFLISKPEMVMNTIVYDPFTLDRDP